MNTSLTATLHVASSAASLRIRTAETPADWQLAHQWLDDEHLLGAGREAGDRLCQFVLEEDQIVAVLIWCAAAWHLKDRHRHRRVNVAQNLALSRNALLAIIPFDEKRNLPSLIADYQDRKQLAIDLILKARPFP